MENEYKEEQERKWEGDERGRDGEVQAVEKNGGHTLGIQGDHSKLHRRMYLHSTHTRSRVHT